MCWISLSSFSRATRRCWIMAVGIQRLKRSSWPAPMMGELYPSALSCNADSNILDGARHMLCFKVTISNTKPCLSCLLFLIDLNDCPEHFQMVYCTVTIIYNILTCVCPIHLQYTSVCSPPPPPAGSPLVQIMPMERLAWPHICALTHVILYMVQNQPFYHKQWLRR